MHGIVIPMAHFATCLAVVAATVNVLCELARKSPQDYLSLAPQLFHLLTTSSNNWMLIKIIKLVCDPANELSAVCTDAHVVWIPMPSRTSPSEEITSANNRADHDDARDFVTLRMCAHLYHWRDARGKRRKCTCEDVRLETCGFHSGSRPEP